MRELIDSRRTLLRNTLLCLLAAVVFTTIASPAPAELSPTTAVPGSAGTDTSLPDTDSAVTVTGRGPFKDLRVKINQTRNLVNQAVSVVWTGGEPTNRISSRFGENYLQIMQCWGDDDGTNPDNPGPPPEQCVSGAADGVRDSVQGGNFPGGTLATTRIISRSTWGTYNPGIGHLSPNGNVWMPFRSVDGTVVDEQVDPSAGTGSDATAYWQNPYFNIVTTNEIVGARTAPNGAGSELVRIDTGVESSGLGCGQRLIPAGGGQPRIPKCWLIIVPRSSAAYENRDTPFENTAASSGVYTSPLAPAAWENRIAVPLGFNPVDSACDIGAKDRRIAGTELIVPALSSWQPSLCATSGLPPFTFATVPDAVARRLIVSPSVGAAGMAVAPAAVAPGEVDPKSPIVYAPLALSGVVIGFNIERSPKASASEPAQQLAGVRVADLNLTPRLVAKLLTQSYKSQLEIGGALAPYDWYLGNPDSLIGDPDFLQFNPEFGDFQVFNRRNAGGLVLPGRNSDSARLLWRWVLSDPEAKQWMDGRADPWGMRINPYYATTGSQNSTGFPFADPVPDFFPKSDPHCYAPVSDLFSVPPLCGTDWMPYVDGFRQASVSVRAANDGARIVSNPAAITSDQAWRRVAPQTLGSRSMLAVTDASSASLYGAQTARLSRAGDNGPDRLFIAPDSGGLTAAIAGMRAVTDPAVLETDPTLDAPAGYPLASIAYGMLRPLSLDAESRQDYAAFIEYAAGPGQVVGFEPGNLPVGYAALPKDLRDRAVAAAKQVRELQPAPEPAPAPPTSSTGVATGVPSGSSGASPGSAPTPPRPTAAVGSSTPTGASTSTGAVVTEDPVSTETTPALLTPVVALARSRFVVPLIAAIAVIAALVALEITKRPRRGSSSIGSAQ